MTPEQKRAYWKQYLKAMRDIKEEWPTAPDGLDGTDMYLFHGLSTEEFVSISHELEAEHARVS